MVSTTHTNIRCYLAHEINQAPIQTTAWGKEPPVPQLIMNVHVLSHPRDSVLEALSWNGTVYQVMSQFYPRSELWRPDGDTALIFLSANDIWFLGKVDDSWYSAHTPAGSLSGSHGILFTGSSEIYWQDAPASVLGCVTQQQLCDPRRSRSEGCMPLSGLMDAFTAINDTWTDAKHQDLITWAYSAAAPPNLGYIVSTLGIAALQSRYSMTAGLQVPFQPTNGSSKSNSGKPPSWQPCNPTS